MENMRFSYFVSVLALSMGLLLNRGLPPATVSNCHPQQTKCTGEVYILDSNIKPGPFSDFEFIFWRLITAPKMYGPSCICEEKITVDPYDQTLRLEYRKCGPANSVPTPTPSFIPRGPVV